MHLGVSTGPGVPAVIRFDNGIIDGAVSPDGRIAGCHIHGLFNDPAFRTRFLLRSARSAGEDYAQRVDAARRDRNASSTLAIDALCRLASAL